jgi:hypothetical protein
MKRKREAPQGPPPASVPIPERLLDPVSRAAFPSGEAEVDSERAAFCTAHPESVPIDLWRHWAVQPVRWTR